MTLSPSRSFKNFADSPMSRPNLKWTLSSAILKSVIPISFFLLLGASVYLYAKIFSQESFGVVEPTAIEIASSTAYFSKQWLHTQVKQLTSGPIDFHPGINASVISAFHPFSAYTGINVWDLYPPQLSCPDIMRIGKIGEGGKWVCGLSHLSSDHNCVMYSFGISTDVSFEVEIIQRTNCIVHAFDPTVGRLPLRNLEVLTPQQRNRIYFHKTALSIHSGTSEMHSLNEQMLDIMHRLGHTFINLLKVDIEGGEWAVFNGLFGNGVHTSHRHHEQPSIEVLPIGQLLIELHYHTMQDTEAFFTGAAKNGLLPYSREINLQPCLSGGKPLAVEYSFINVDSFYNGASLFKTVPAAHTPEWHKPIQAVIYYLTQRSRVEMMRKALRSLYDNFCKDYPSYPVLIFHDDLRSSDERALLAAVPHLQLKFVKITLSTPEELVRSGVHIPDRTTCAPDSSTLGYRHMCRFHATGIHQHLDELGYGKYEYVMRMDDDGLLNSPVGYDLFRYMKVNDKQYGFVNLVADDPTCIVDLWEKSAQFFNNATIPNKEDALFPDWPKGAVYYNNFEISALSLWRDPTWRAYMAYIDETAGIYTLRWGDAPLHTIGVSMVLSREQIHAFTDIAYQHNPFVNQVPKGLPMPKMDPFAGPDVECRYYDKWMCHHVQAETGQNFSMNSTANGSVAALMTNFSSVSLKVSLDHIFNLLYMTGDMTRPGNQLAVASKHTPLSLGAVGQAALYSFGHGGREPLLAATLQSFFDNYLAFHPAQIVVFYSDRGSFDVKQVQRNLAGSRVLPLVTFKPVSLASTEAFQVRAGCASTNAEVRASSLFFRYEAVNILKSLGFSWIFRFGDDSRLNKPIRHNLFELMHGEGKRYGFLDQLNDRPECVDDLHDAVLALCRSADGTASSNSTATGLPQRQRNLRASRNETTSKSLAARELSPRSAPAIAQCSSLFHTWPNRRLMLSSFEISHVSVWDSPICQKIFASASYASSTGSSPQPLWGDAILHTYCVLTSLTAREIIQLKDVEYHFNWTTATHINVRDPRDRSAQYKTTTVSAYDQAFTAQRVGWLGGDIAASVALPNEIDDRLPPKKMLWLFGDSIIGVSSNERRIRDFSTMIANTVAVVTLAEEKIRSCDAPVSTAQERPIEQTSYFWNTAADGAPQELFSIPPQNKCPAEEQRLWPIAGITYVPPSTAGKVDTAGVKLLLLVDVVCLRGVAAETLIFEDYKTALVVVHNPLDLPSTWRFDYKIFTNPPGGKLKWIAFNNAKGGLFARPGEDIYILGGFQPSSQAAGHQVLGRISAEQLLKMDLSSLELLSQSDSGAAVWTGVYANTAVAAIASTPKALFGPLLSEASMHFDVTTQEWVVVSLLPMNKHIEVCRTPDITAPPASPWNCTLVSEVDAKWIGRAPILMTYAAKAHQPLLTSPHTCIDSQNTIHTTPAPAAGARARPLDLVVSYVSNAVESTDALYLPDYKDAYSPKFVRISHTQKA